MNKKKLFTIGKRMNKKKLFTNFLCFMLIFISTVSTSFATQESLKIDTEVFTHDGITYEATVSESKSGIVTRTLKDGKENLESTFNSKTGQLIIKSNGVEISNQFVFSGEEFIAEEDFSTMSANWSLLQRNRNKMWVEGFSVAAIALGMAQIAGGPTAWFLNVAAVAAGSTMWMSYDKGKYVDRNTIGDIAMHIKNETIWYYDATWSSYATTYTWYEWIYY